MEAVTLVPNLMNAPLVTVRFVPQADVSARGWPPSLALIPLFLLHWTMSQARSAPLALLQDSAFLVAQFGDACRSPSDAMP